MIGDRSNRKEMKKMKKKYLALVLGMVLTASSVSVCMAEAQSNVESAAGETGETNAEAPEQPNGENSEQPGQEPPEKPDGEGAEKPDGEPPEKPDGEEPEKPDGEAPEKPDGEPGQGPGGMGMEGVDSYEAVYAYTQNESLEGETLESTGTDENVVLISDGAEVSVKDSTITRNSDDSTGGDQSSFYGVGAAVLAENGTAYVKGGTVDTNASGAAGLFAYGDGTVYASDAVIRTEQDTSGGIHAAGGGTFYAWDLDVETNGESAAAIRSDRGGGTMVVDGGTYTSNGLGSPAVYCTADIAVNNAQLTATGSEAVCIEGLNSLRLFDCDLTGNMTDQDQNDCTWNVILYQSMSGDSEVGNSTFQMTGGTMEAQNGGIFYTTNTESTFLLENVEITGNEDNEFFLRCTGNANERGWGTTGENGADCSFTAIQQEMEGDIIWDSISNLDFYMRDGSVLTGAVQQDETYAGNGGEGYCNLYLGEGTTWTVTGDSSLTTLANEGTIVDSEGKTVSIMGEDGTLYVEGDSAYTVTVGSYEEQADLSGSMTPDTWENIQIEKPEELL